MADYSRQINNADRQIRAKGALVDYVVTPSNAGDTPWFPTSGVGVIYSQTPIIQVNEGIARYFELQFKAAINDGADIDTLQFLIPGKVPFTPSFRDVIRWANGNDYYVKDLDIIAPSGVPILYFIQGDQI